MPDKVWKAFERRVAKAFGAVRNSLSGGNAKTTRSDVLHPELFIECKYKTRSSLWTLFRDVREKAKKEGKTPVVAIGEKGAKGWLVVMHISDLEQIVRELSVVH